MKLLTKECPLCHKEFNTYSPVKIYCSNRCRAYAKALRQQESEQPKKRQSVLNYGASTCEYCHKEYTRKQHNQKYCSDKCRNKAKTIGKEPTIRELVCEECGKSFTFNRKKKYCSEECRSNHNAKSPKPKLTTKQEKKIKKIKSHKEIFKETVDINARARAEGLSYGQYMAKIYAQENSIRRCTK